VSWLDQLLCKLGLKQDTPQVRSSVINPLLESHHEELKKAAKILHKQRKIAEEVGALNAQQVREAKDAEALLRNLVDRLAAGNGMSK
jgi:hypothetical protein